MSHFGNIFGIAKAACLCWVIEGFLGMTFAMSADKVVQAYTFNLDYVGTIDEVGKELTKIIIASLALILGIACMALFMRMAAKSLKGSVAEDSSGSGCVMEDLYDDEVNARTHREYLEEERRKYQ